ncbi:MAG: hypothetical protein V1787_03895 [Candidatus Micrarchaeota archaeon]
MQLSRELELLGLHPEIVDYSTGLHVRIKLSGKNRDSLHEMIRSMQGGRPFTLGRHADERLALTAHVREYFEERFPGKFRNYYGQEFPVRLKVEGVLGRLRGGRIEMRERER